MMDPNAFSTSDEATPKAAVTSAFGKLSLRDVVVTSTKDAKKRLISDIEYLSNEQYAYLEQYTQKKFFGFVQQYWAGKVLEKNMTAKTFRGEVISFDFSQIKVVDKRYKGGSHCICGKAIRYEYWLNNYGPIGSVHICEHAGLNDQLVKDLVKGYKDQNELRTDIVDILVEMKDKGRTFEDWANDFRLSEMMPAAECIPEINRQLILDLLNLKLPLTKDLRAIFVRAHKTYVYRQSQASTAPAPAATPEVSTVRLEFATLIEKGEEVIVRFNAIPELAKHTKGVRQKMYDVNTLKSILGVFRLGKGTPAQINYANKLIDRIATECAGNASQVYKTTTKAYSEPEIQEMARAALSYIVNNYPTDSFARNLHTQSVTKQLTVNQIACIFGEQNTGMYRNVPSLYAKYKLQGAGVPTPR